MLSTRNDEKDALKEQVEQLKQDLNSAEDELDTAVRRLERHHGKQGSDGAIGEMSREELERVSHDTSNKLFICACSSDIAVI